MGLPEGMRQPRDAVHERMTAGLDPSDPRLAPIRGVDIATYARISKAAATDGLDDSALLLHAASLGVSAAAWEAASTGWPARMRGDTALGTHYGLVYGQA